MIPQRRTTQPRVHLKIKRKISEDLLLNLKCLSSKETHQDDKITQSQTLEILTKPFFKRHYDDLIILQNYFEQSTDLNEIPLPILNQCFQKMTVREGSKGDAIYSQGEPIDNFYVVIKGSVEEVMAPEGNQKGMWYRMQMKKKQPIKNNLNDNQKQIKIFKENKLFGLQRLSFKNLRNSSVKCLEDCIFGCVELKVYYEIKMKYEEQLKKQQIECLKKMELFKQYTNHELHQIYNQSTEEKFVTNNIIYKQNDESNKFYIIKQGQFKVIKSSPLNLSNEQQQDCHNCNCNKKDNQSPSNIESVILGANEYFGDIELITASKRTHTVISLTANGILLSISKKIFLKRIYYHHLNLFNNYMVDLNFDKFKARKQRENIAKNLNNNKKNNNNNNYQQQSQSQQQSREQLPEFLIVENQSGAMRISSENIKEQIINLRKMYPTMNEKFFKHKIILDQQKMLRIDGILKERQRKVKEREDCLRIKGMRKDWVIERGMQEEEESEADIFNFTKGEKGKSAGELVSWQELFEKSEGKYQQQSTQCQSQTTLQSPIKLSKSPGYLQKMNPRPLSCMKSERKLSQFISNKHYKSTKNEIFHNQQRNFNTNILTYLEKKISNNPLLYQIKEKIQRNSSSGGSSSNNINSQDFCTSARIIVRQDAFGFKKLKSIEEERKKIQSLKRKSSYQ